MEKGFPVDGRFFVDFTAEEQNESPSGRNTLRMWAIHRSGLNVDEHATNARAHGVERKLFVEDIQMCLPGKVVMDQPVLDHQELVVFSEADIVLGFRVRWSFHVERCR